MYEDLTPPSRRPIGVSSSPSYERSRYSWNSSYFTKRQQSRLTNPSSSISCGRGDKNDHKHINPLCCNIGLSSAEAVLLQFSAFYCVSSIVVHLKTMIQDSRTQRPDTENKKQTLYAISVASLRVLSLCTSSLLSIIIFTGCTQKSFIWKWTKTENIKLVLKIKRAREIELSQKDCVLCKCFAQSLSVASPAPLTPSPSEPNSLCVLGSLPQINTLERWQTWVTIKIHTYSRTSRQQRI